MSRQDRQGVRTAVDLERKYNFGESRNYIIKVQEEQERLSGHLNEVEKKLDEEVGRFTEYETTIFNNFETILLEALEHYVETENFDEYKETISTQLQIMSDEILMNFTTTTSQITEVDGDFQGRFSELYEYISFSGGSITLGASDSKITLVIDNDRIVFKRNGIEFGSWDVDNFYTGNIIIRLGERFQYGSFADIPRPDGSVITVWVGE